MLNNCIVHLFWYSQADLEDCSADDFYVVQDRFLLGHTDEEVCNGCIARHVMLYRHDADCIFGGRCRLRGT